MSDPCERFEKELIGAMHEKVKWELTSVDLDPPMGKPGYTTKVLERRKLAHEEYLKAHEALGDCLKKLYG